MKKFKPSLRFSHQVQTTHRAAPFYLEKTHKAALSSDKRSEKILVLQKRASFERHYCRSYVAFISVDVNIHPFTPSQVALRISSQLSQFSVSSNYKQCLSAKGHLVQVFSLFSNRWREFAHNGDGKAAKRTSPLRN